MKRRDQRRRAGFTLMEVLLVLAILVILASLAVVQLGGVMGRADRDSARTQIGSFESAIGLYHVAIRQYPPNLQALVAPPGDLPNPAKWAGPYLKEIPLDPWDRQYQYAAPGKHNVTTFDVWSLGPDGVDGTDDDIGNWLTASTK